MSVSENICVANGQAADDEYANIFLFTANFINVKGNTCRNFDFEFEYPENTNFGIWDSGGSNNLIINNDLLESGTEAAIRNDSFDTNFGAGNRLNDGTWAVGDDF